MRFPAVLLVVFALAAEARACNIPVFRYALERWQPDPYQLFVFHEGPLADKDRAALDQLRRRLDSRELPANLIVEVIDVAGKVAANHQKVLDQAKPAALPWMVLRFPETTALPFILHSGPLDLALVPALIDSPARREIARRLLAGQSTVWIFLESGDPKVDEPIAAHLAKTLAKLQDDLKLPERTDEPRDQLHNDTIPLKVEFSVLRLARGDRAEAALVRQLLHLEEDLADRPEPMVFPVFGRGLGLYAIVGKGITKGNNLENAARFVTGACSCEVKRLNPGVDLLMNVNWDGTPPPEATFDPPPTPASGNYQLWRNIIIAVGGLAVVLLLGSMMVFARKKAS